MALVFNGTTLKWYEDTIVFDGTTVSSPDAPGDVVLNTTKVHGLSGTYDTNLYSSSLSPDSSYFENTIVPYFQNELADAFHSQSYTLGPGQDSIYRVYLKAGYQIVSDDGTFTGSNSPGTQVDFYEGKTVTGINTSHNGGTAFTFYRDEGV